MSPDPNKVIAAELGLSPKTIENHRAAIMAKIGAAANEHPEVHLCAMLTFIGVTDIEFIVAEGVAFGSEQREAAMSGAFDRVGRIEALALAA